jgi:hypothetical protein
MQLTTTLRLCSQNNACTWQYGLLVQALGPDWGDDAPIPLLMLLDLKAGPRWRALSNTLWALQAVPPEQAQYRDFVARLLAVRYAEMVLPVCERGMPTDPRVRQSLQVADRCATRGEFAVAALWAANAIIYTSTDAASAYVRNEPTDARAKQAKILREMLTMACHVPQTRDGGNKS